MQLSYAIIWRENMSLKQILKSTRVIILLICLLFALITIKPEPWNNGVMVRAVTFNSSAADAGIPNPKPNIAPLDHESIIAVNDAKINSLEDYYTSVAAIKPNQTVRVVTNKASYILVARPLFNDTVLNETELTFVNEFDNKTNTTIPKAIAVPKVQRELIGVEDIGIKVAEAPTSNIRKGLDLAGGSRVLLQPEEAVTNDDLASIIQSLTERLNVYGLSDVIVHDATDLAGSKFIIVEIAGVTEEEVRNLLARQGKFEATIANKTVFIGGKQDITYVCRTAECSGLDSRRVCGRDSSGSWGCGFFFSITLSTDAAQRQADITKTLEVVNEGTGNQYLSSPIELYLDDKLVDTLQIAAELKGQASTNIAITGSGSGKTKQDAANNALQNMKKLQTILITGSLPVKLSIVKLDTLSPVLGERFMKNILLIAIAAFISVALVVGIRYQSLKVALPMIVTLIAEIILTLGFAALVGWNIDVAAMAGIIISIGTGVDHLVIIADETLRGEIVSDWKKRLKNALFIIFGAYLTVLAGMIPLWFAGAGLLKGFAFTTIAGVSFGVLIARPAYAAILKILLKA